MPRFALRRAHIERITGYPNPFEAYLLVACVVQGALVVTGVARPGAIEAALSGVPGLRYVWALLLLLGGLLGLLGLYWRGENETAGVLIKRAGLICVGFGTLVYGIALALAGATAYVASLTTLAFAWAAFTRAAQVTRMLRDAEKRSRQEDAS